MTDHPTWVYIERALRRGPMYEGALRLVVGRKDFYRALRRMQDKGQIERVPDEPLTWRLS